MVSFFLNFSKLGGSSSAATAFACAACQASKSIDSTSREYSNTPSAPAFSTSAGGTKSSGFTPSGSPGGGARRWTSAARSAAASLTGITATAGNSPSVLSLGSSSTMAAGRVRSKASSTARFPSKSPASWSVSIPSGVSGSTAFTSFCERSRTCWSDER